MAYRSTKEKAEAQKAARKLYVEDGLSLKEIHQQTGETMRTLRSWRNLGDWENLREAEDKTELDRLWNLRDSLLDKAEAQIKADKLPHTETGLIHKLERVIVQREKKVERIDAIMLNTLQYLTLYLMEHDPELARALVINHVEEFTGWIIKQDLVRPPEEAGRLVREFTRQPQEFTRQPQGSARPPQGFARQRYEFAQSPQGSARPPQRSARAQKELTRAQKNLARAQRNLPRMRENLARTRENLAPSMK